MYILKLNWTAVSLLIILRNRFHLITIGSLSNDDGDDNENGKNARGLICKLCTCFTPFLYFSLTKGDSKFFSDGYVTNSLPSCEKSLLRRKEVLFLDRPVKWKLLKAIHLGPVVRTPVSTNPGLNFNPAFFFLLSKALFRIIFSILFRVSNHQIVGKKN